MEHKGYKCVRISCTGQEVHRALLPLIRVSETHALLPLKPGQPPGKELQLEITFPNGKTYRMNSTVEQTEAVTPAELVRCRLIFGDEAAAREFSEEVAGCVEGEELREKEYLFDVLTDISNALGAEIHFDDLLRVIIGKITGILNADRSSLFVYDEGKRELWSKVTEGLDQKIISFPVSSGVAGHVATTRRSLIIHDAYQDTRFNPEIDRNHHYRTKSIVCAPLINSNGKLVGVVEVLNKKDGSVFDERDRSLLELLSTQVTIALERAQLTEDYIRREKMEKELVMAGDLQMSLLPRQPFPERAGSRIGLQARIIPAGSVGGDFYDFFYLDDQQVFFVIGDVSGKGMPAALFMAVTRTLIRALANRGTTADEVLFKVNNELCRDNDSCMFVTIFMGVLNTRTGQILYSNAGHTLPFHISADGVVEELEAEEGIALGIAEGYEFGMKKTTLEPQASVFLFTDGMSEAMDETGNEYSCERIKNCLGQLSEYSAENIIRASIEDVRRFKSTAPQSDDITALALQYMG